MSGALKYEKDSFTVVDLLGWGRGLVSGEPVDLVQTRESNRYGGDLRFAWAAVDWLGVSAMAGGRFGDNLEEEQDKEFFPTLGIAFDADLYARTAVPLGVVLGYSQESFPRATSDVAEAIRSFQIRLAYTGRDDFILALDSTVDRLPVTDGETLEAGTLLFHMRYYF